MNNVTNTTDNFSAIRTAIASADAAWIEFAMCELAHATTYGTARIDRDNWRFFLGCSHQLGFAKVDGVLCRGERKPLSPAQNAVLASIIARNDSLVAVVVQGAARGEGRVFPPVPQAAPKAVKKTRAEKQKEAAEAFAATKEGQLVGALKSLVSLGSLGVDKQLKKELRSLLKSAT